MSRFIFNTHEQNSAIWIERAKCTAYLIAQNEVSSSRLIRVADIGAGNQKLRSSLEDLDLRIEYSAYDLMPQSELGPIEQFDVTSDVLDSEFEYVTMLGLLEYVDDKSAVLRSVSPNTDFLIASFLIRNDERYSAEVRFIRGWYPLLDIEGVRELFRSSNFQIIRELLIDGGKTIVVLAKTLRHF